MKKTGLFTALLLSAACMLTPLSLFAAETSADEQPSTDTPAIDTPADGESGTNDPVATPEPAENTVLLTNTSPLRAGQEVTFTFSCNGKDLRALQGSITYDRTQLTYQEKNTSTTGGGWFLNLSDDPEAGKLTYFVFSAEPVSGVSRLFSITFTVNADLAEGDSIVFEIADAAAVKGEDELTTFTGGPLTFTVDRPISDEAALTALAVETGTLSPAFDPAITAYTLQVPFDCQTLVLSAAPVSYATVAISDTTLDVGSNSVTITVTAESGTQNVYTIEVTRLSDPNYIPSADSLLSGITLSDGMLFPAFSPSVTEYTVYIVNEGAITLTPLPATLGSAEAVTLDAASGATCSITSVAEDGSTTLYRFTALRVQTPEQLAQSGQSGNGSANGNEYSMQVGLFVALLAVVAVSLFFVGFGASHLMGSKKKKTSASASKSIEDHENAESPEDSGLDELS